jgi:NADPH:quinone reductase-like Zn-dependent oxidoreductase
MRAVVYKKYGKPEVAHIEEIERPVPKDNELLIKVYASTVNRTDAGFRSAEYFVSRFFSGLFKPKYPVLGCEFAGIIEEMGKNVTNFNRFAKVFGYNDFRFGGHGEYLILHKNDALTYMPYNLNFIESAPLCEGAHYALCNIRAAKVKYGDEVMVYGATGAIGSAAVQLLKHFGAKVTAVCATAQVSLVKSLGADEVIDYLTQDFTTCNKHFNFIFDAVGKSSFSACKPLLKENGIYISTELGKNGENIFLAIMGKIKGGKRVLFPIPSTKKEDIELLKELAESGVYKPIIDKVYPLEEIVDAYHYVESGQKIGNVVLKIVNI